MMAGTIAAYYKDKERNKELFAIIKKRIEDLVEYS